MVKNGQKNLENLKKSLFSKILKILKYFFVAEKMLLT